MSVAGVVLSAIHDFPPEANGGPAHAGCPATVSRPRPWKRMVDQLMQGAPPQSAGHASASGWTDAGLFLKWMEHFVLYINTSTQNRHLIVLDEHHSHKTLDAVNYARAHGIELIALPPHCTHKMQPLDRCFFKSLKNAYIISADNWMMSHHGQRISIYDMSGISLCEH